MHMMSHLAPGATVEEACHAILQKIPELCRSEKKRSNGLPAIIMVARQKQEAKLHITGYYSHSYSI